MQRPKWAEAKNWNWHNYDNKSEWNEIRPNAVSPVTHIQFSKTTYQDATAVCLSPIQWQPYCRINRNGCVTCVRVSRYKIGVPRLRCWTDVEALARAGYRTWTFLL